MYESLPGLYLKKIEREIDGGLMFFKFLNFVTSIESLRASLLGPLPLLWSGAAIVRNLTPSPKRELFVSSHVTSPS